VSAPRIGDFGGLEVAHFPDHDDVWIAAQDAAQPGGEGQADLGFDAIWTRRRVCFPPDPRS
jgi:hypothetical protein